MNYSFIPEEFAGPVPPPPPSLNGGLYTGKPFDKGAPWANIPVTPDSGVYVNKNLLSANPPPGANTQYPGNIRPGNNMQTMPGVAAYDPSWGDMETNVPSADASGMTCSFGGGKYAVWNADAR